MASDSTNVQNDPSILDECSKSNADHEDINIIDVNKCKNCKQQYRSLLKHLGQRKLCINSYSEQEIKKLKFTVKSASHHLKREKEKIRYQQNKENILRKRKEHYEKNKHHVCEKKSNYYHKNSEKYLQRRAAQYLKYKKRAKENDEENKN